MAKHGEMLLIYFDYEEYRYVCGHVDHEAAVDACDAHCGSEDYDDEIVHGWARWVPDSSGEYDMVFLPCKQGRGAFKTTRLSITSAREHREKVNAQVLGGE
jgi:hypothetical protein